MLGKNTSQYRLWADHASYLKSMPKDCQVVNTGSTPSFKAFDYSLWNVIGFNLGFQPQPLYYDFETLKKYSNNIAKDAKILIGIEEFKFLVDAYEDEATDHKYYLWLDKKQIRTYSKQKDWIIKYAPIMLHPRFLLRDIKNNLFTLFRLKEKNLCYKVPYDERQDIQYAERRVQGWNKEFGWENGQRIRSEQEQVIAINEKRLSDMVDYCYRQGWTPYLIVPPFSPNLKKLLSDQVLKQGLWDPLDRIREKKNIPLYNFYDDHRFADYHLYADALTLNEDGRKLFNDLIQQKLGILEVDRLNNKKTFQLRNGVEIPWISYGTGVIWKYTRNTPLFIICNFKAVLKSVKHLKVNRELYGNIHIKRAIADAYDAGFRMFDTGRIYAHSEDRIGAVISNRPDAMIATKCSWMDITRKCSPDTVEGNLDISLRNLEREKVDLYLLHWPEGEWIDTYTQIINEYKKGRCRAFGACNLKLEHLMQIEDAGLDMPMVIQTEIHPLNVQKELREYCQSHGIQLQAHAPTGHSVKDLIESEVMKKLTAKYHKSSVQITLRWHYQNHIIPVVSTFSKQHMKDNLDIFDFKLTDDEMTAIDSLDKGRMFLKTQGIDDPNYIYNY